MKTTKILLNFLLICLAFISCGQTKLNPEVKKQILTEPKYTKVISDPTNKLIPKIESLEIAYTVWGCACPNWIRTKDRDYTDTTKSYLSYHFYLEQANKNLDFPIYFDAFRHIVKVEGQFYEKEDYPQGTVEMEEPMPKAKVFRYTKIEVLDNPQFDPETKIETLILSYNVLSCPCPKWQEEGRKTNSKENIWLEKSNGKLIDADTLFNGNDLPLKIKVTGQFICQNGFPKSENLAKVSQESASKVFRYTKIEVLQNGLIKNGR